MKNDTKSPPRPASRPATSRPSSRKPVSAAAGQERKTDINPFMKDKRRAGGDEAPVSMDKRRAGSGAAGVPGKASAPASAFKGKRSPASGSAAVSGKTSVPAMKGERRSAPGKVPARSAPERKSFNPNFTPDNKPTWDAPAGKKSYGKKGYEKKSYAAGERKSAGFDKPAKKGFGKKESFSADRKGGFVKKEGFGKKDTFGKKEAYGKPAGKGFGKDFEKKETFGKPHKDGFAFKRAGAAGAEKAKRTERAARPAGAARPPAGATRPPRAAVESVRPAGATKVATDKAVRLNRFIAVSGVCSRREADHYILAGVVTVNGQVVMELGTKVSSGDDVRFNDQPITGEQKVYILMNKPKGFVTTVEDPHADRTVIDIVKGKCDQRVYPVGRLDRNSMGVLLITNDGDLTRRLTHPSFDRKKVYQITLDKSLTKADLERMLAGVELEDGFIKVDDASWLDAGKKEIGVEVHSGRNRVIRRIFEHLGYRVTKLDRVYFAGLTKEGLRRGAWRFLTPAEVATLKSGKYE